jgi:hypothetical protein
VILPIYRDSRFNIHDFPDSIVILIHTYIKTARIYHCTISSVLIMNFSVFKNDGIWTYYLRDSSRQNAKCKQCNKILKCTGGSTKGLHAHQKSLHGVSIDGHNSSLPQSVLENREMLEKKKQTAIQPFIKMKLVPIDTNIRVDRKERPPKQISPQPTRKKRQPRKQIKWERL